MKAKISHLIILSLASGILYGRYLLKPEQETPSAKKPQAAKVIAQSSPVIIQNTSWNIPKPAVDFDSPPIDDISLRADLNAMLTTLRPDERIQLADISNIAHCASCVQLLKDYLLAGNLSKKQLAQLANSLSRGNHPELATMLVETIEKMLRSGQGKRGELVMNALVTFNSAQVAQRFSDYLASTPEIPRSLQDALINNINETTNRRQVAADLVKQFNAMNDVAGREKLLAIDHPEALAQINSQALAQGNAELYNQTIEQLKSNPSKYALDAVLALKDTPSVDNQLLDAAYTLANRQLSGNRLDYIENKLAQGGYSEQDKSIVLDVLTHSEDQVRGSEIVAKFTH